jgi:hypothetical protein
MSYFHPERMPALPARRRAAARQQLEELVARSGRSRGRRSPVLIVAVIAVIVLSTGAAGVAAYRAITIQAVGRCFTVDSVTSRDFTTLAAAGRPLTKAAAQDARAACSALFREGLVEPGTGVLVPDRTGIPHSVPPLVVCVWRDGSAAVFPGKAGTCARLGLSAAARR